MIKKKLLHYSRLVKLEHTVFALPFALSALVLAAPVGQWPPLVTVGWVLLAMVGGRTYAMGLNRLLDATLDAKNPRTANRELPAGLVKPWEAWLLTLGALGLLVLATVQLPSVCVQLLPVAVGLLTLYSYTKRFTALCHLVLGVALGSSAIGGWLALTGHWNNGLPILLGLAVTFWVAGFDVIYACQDVAFDQQEGLHSLPAWLGVGKALALSKAFHAASGLCLLAFGVTYGILKAPLGGAFWVATLGMMGLMAWQHRLVSPNNLNQINQAFFTLNSLISLGFLACILLEKLLH